MSHVSYSTYLVQLSKVSNFMPLPYLLHLSREYQRHEHYSNVIKSGAKFTYFGVTLEQNLSGSNMVTKIVSKCNNKIKFLYRNAKNLDKKTRCF